jgi:hypothetical protein
LKYLGTPVAARRKIKLEAVESKLSEMRVRLKKIMESQLLTVQKIDAVKTFLLPTLDFMMLNGDVGETQLKKMDQHIRVSIDEVLRVRGLPVECHHASWRDGGLSYPSLEDRRRVLMIRSFTQMMLSRDDKIKRAMRWFAEDERQYRCITEDQRSQFLNWKNEKGESGTAALVAKTRKACRKMNIGLKLTNDEVVLITNETEYKTKTAVGIGRFLTQKVIRTGKIDKLIAHTVRGAGFTTLKDNEVSNMMLTNVYTRRSDSDFRFVVVGRADCLPTPVNLQLWFGDRRGERCHRCTLNRRPTFAHILNGCTMNFGLYTARHDQLSNVVRRAVITCLGEDLRSEIALGIETQDEGIPEELKVLKPDMMFTRRSPTGPGSNSPEKGRRGSEGMERHGEDMIEIIEFTCPYGHISHGRDTLKARYEEKQQKYAELAHELSRVRHTPVRVTAVIVSSMGAVYGPSLAALRRVLACSDQELIRLCRRMSEAVIVGSFGIWRVHARECAAMNSEMSDDAGAEEADAEIREEVSRLQTAGTERELITRRDDDGGDESSQTEECEREIELQIRVNERGRDDQRAEKDAEREPDADIGVFGVDDREEGEESAAGEVREITEVIGERGVMMPDEPADDESIDSEVWFQ